MRSQRDFLSIFAEAANCEVKEDIVFRGYLVSIYHHSLSACRPTGKSGGVIYWFWVPVKSRAAVLPDSAALGKDSPRELERTLPLSAG